MIEIEEIPPLPALHQCPQLMCGPTMFALCERIQTPIAAPAERGPAWNSQLIRHVAHALGASLFAPRAQVTEEKLQVIQQQFTFHRVMVV